MILHDNDVCLCFTERLFDKVDNCEELKQIGFCTNGQNVLSKCAYTCAQYLPPMDKPIVCKYVCLSVSTQSLSPTEKPICVSLSKCLSVSMSICQYV